MLFDIIISTIFITIIITAVLIIIIITNIPITIITILYSLLALIANNRLVCSGRVKSLPIDGVVWYVALHNNDGDDVDDDVNGDVDDDVDGDVNHDVDDDVVNRDGDDDCSRVKSLPIDGVVWYVALHNNDGDDVDGDVNDDDDGDVNHGVDDDVANRDGNDDCGCSESFPIDGVVWYVVLRRK